MGDLLLMLRVELSKVFSKWRTFIGYIAIGILVPIIVVAMRAEGVSYFAFATQSIKDVFESVSYTHLTLPTKRIV